MELPLHIIVLISVVVIVLIVVAGFFIMQTGSSIQQISECENKGGICQYSCEGGAVSTFKCENGIASETNDQKIMAIGIGEVVCCFVQ